MDTIASFAFLSAVIVDVGGVVLEHLGCPTVVDTVLMGLLHECDQFAC